MDGGLGGRRVKWQGTNCGYDNNLKLLRKGFLSLLSLTGYSWIDLSLSPVTVSGPVYYYFSPQGHLSRMWRVEDKSRGCGCMSAPP